METLKEILAGTTPVLIDFFAEWCAPCKAMRPTLDNLKREYGEKVRIIKIDIDKNSTIARSCNIQSVPTLILYKNGQSVWRASGARPLSELKEVIDRFI